MRGALWAVGRNYREHARELGNEAPSEPFFFLKASAALWNGELPLRLPFGRGPIHHEVELVVEIGALPEDGSELTPARAGRAVRRAGVGLDLTLRELQTSLKAKGLPWALAKSFPNAAVVSPLVDVDDAAALGDLPLSLAIDGAVRQSDRTSSMIFGVAELIAYLAARVPLSEGDLLFTGTPAGVSALAAGQILHAALGDLATLTLPIAGSP